MNSVKSLLILILLTLFVGNDTNDLSSVTAVEGDRVELKCERKTDTPVNWKVVDTNQYIVIGSHLYEEHRPKFELDPLDCTLTINNVTVDDSTLYSCTEDTGLGEIHPVQLNVARLSTATEGDSVQLKCKNQFDAPVNWKYQNHVTEGNTYVVNGGNLVDAYKARRFELNPIDYTLTINNVTLNDSGTYSCIEYSDRGHANYVKLVVHTRVVRGSILLDPTRPDPPASRPDPTRRSDEKC